MIAHEPAKFTLVKLEFIDDLNETTARGDGITKDHK